MEKQIIDLIEESSNIKEKFIISDLPVSRICDRKSQTIKYNIIKNKNIYKNLDFIQWRDKLVNELSKLKQDKLVLKINKLLNGFKGIDDDTRFEELEEDLKELKSHISEYILDENETIVNSKEFLEQEIVDSIERALIKLQKNSAYDSSSSENALNDYIRDILDEKFSIKDQTRQGRSEKGDNAGEVDLQICIDGLPMVMMEALILDSLDKRYLAKHIDKVLTNYDPNGCPYDIIIIYVTAKKFDKFIIKLNKYLVQYNFQYKVESSIIKVPTKYAECSHFKTILNRNDKNVSFHFFAIHLV